MRALWRVVALAGQRSRQFADTGGIEDFPINLDVVAVEPSGQCYQDARKRSVVVSRQIRYPSLTLTDPATGNPVVVAYGDPRAMNAARQVTFGFRWSF